MTEGEGPCLGLVGGLGVDATVHYYQELVKAYSGAGGDPLAADQGDDPGTGGAMLPGLESAPCGSSHRDGMGAFALIVPSAIDFSQRKLAPRLGLCVCSWLGDLIECYVSPLEMPGHAVWWKGMTDENEKELLCATFGTCSSSLWVCAPSQALHRRYRARRSSRTRWCRLRRMRSRFI